MHPADAPPLLAPLLSQAGALWCERDSAATTDWPATEARWLAEAWLIWLSQHSDLTPPARQALIPCGHLLMLAAESGIAVWSAANSPLRNLIEQAAALLRGLDAHSGRRVSTLPAQLSSLWVAVAEGRRNLAEAGDALISLIREAAAAVRPVEEALIQKEREQTRREDANVAITRLLDQHIGVRPLPAFAQAWINGPLRKLLHILHVQGEGGRDALKTLTQAFDDLLWALTEADANSLKQQYGQRVSAAQTTLDTVSAGVQGSNADNARFFEALEQHLFLILSGQTPPAADTVWLPQTEAAAAEDQGLQARVLRVGDWLEVPSSAGPVRARLLDKDLHRGVYLFANLSGLRVARVRQAELIDWLRSGSARPIDNRPLFLACQPAVAEHLENRIQQLREDAVQRAEQARQAEAVRLRAELEKARAHLAAERAKRQADLQARAAAEARSRLIETCTPECARLQSGAWVELWVNGGWQRAQLALILARTGERLFVDSTGKKLLQADLLSLATLCADQHLRIRDHGRALDDTLRQMVQERRQHLEAQNR